MKSTKRYAATSFRFRRWSRAGYAVFCSLSSTVTIGSLAVSVSDKSLQKSTGTSVNSILSFANDPESADNPAELPDLKAALHQLEELSLIETSTVSTAACSQYPNINFIHRNG